MITCMDQKGLFRRNTIGVPIAFSQVPCTEIPIIGIPRVSVSLFFLRRYNDVPTLNDLPNKAIFNQPFPMNTTEFRSFNRSETLILQWFQYFQGLGQFFLRGCHFTTFSFLG